MVPHLVSARIVRERESSKSKVPENDEKFDFRNLKEITSEIIIDVLKYIGGYVVLKLMKIKKVASCENCVQLLRNDPVESSLIKIKDRGGLVYPSKELFSVCEAVERIFRANNDKVFAPGFVKCTVYEIMKTCGKYFACDSPSHDAEHKKLLIQLICEHFLKVRLTQEKSRLADLKWESKSDGSDSDWVTDSDSDF